MHKHLPTVKLFALAALVCLGLHSCTSIKQYKYFQDIPDSTRSLILKPSKFVSAPIKAGDVLSVNILTADVTATAPVNAANAMVTSDYPGYVVDKDGNIEMPIIGKIKVSGLSIPEIKDLVTVRAKMYYENPIVYVKNKAIKITVLGEVTKPGFITTTTEKVSIIDLLALTGELTAYAQRDNILLMRQNTDSTITTVRLNLKSTKIIKSPYYYLQNNDVLYFEPTKGKAIASDVVFTRNLSYLGFLTSFASLVFIFIKR